MVQTLPITKTELESTKKTQTTFLNNPKNKLHLPRVNESDLRSLITNGTLSASPLIKKESIKNKSKKKIPGFDWRSRLKDSLNFRRRKTQRPDQRFTEKVEGYGERAALPAGE
jgi:hypothetical protein